MSSPRALNIGFKHVAHAAPAHLLLRRERLDDRGALFVVERARIAALDREIVDLLEQAPLLRKPGSLGAERRVGDQRTAPQRRLAPEYGALMKDRLLQRAEERPVAQRGVAAGLCGDQPVEFLAHQRARGVLAAPAFRNRVAMRERLADGLARSAQRRDEGVAAARLGFLGGRRLRLAPLARIGEIALTEVAAFGEVVERATEFICAQGLAEAPCAQGVGFRRHRARPIGRAE